MRVSNLALPTAIAICAATSAFAADTTVNIVDPTIPARIARVEPGNRLAVQDVAPNTYFHANNLNLSGSCTTIATVPSGKALIVRQIRIDVYSDPTPGNGKFVDILANGCVGIVADINPPSIGQYVVNFDPGLALPDGAVLSAGVATGVGAEAFVDGYLVSPSVVPLVGQVVQTNGEPRHGQR
jgi:hypothetical protein